MINKNPKTYNEIVRLKKCYTLANQYTNITEEIFEEMYNFLEEDSENSILGTQGLLLFLDKNRKRVKEYVVTPKYNNFDKITMNDRDYIVTNRYDINNHRSWSGSSGNNNNNNNNNNNS